MTCKGGGGEQESRCRAGTGSWERAAQLRPRAWAGTRRGTSKLPLLGPSKQSTCKAGGSGSSPGRTRPAPAPRPPPPPSRPGRARCACAAGAGGRLRRGEAPHSACWAGCCGAGWWCRGRSLPPARSARKRNGRGDGAAAERRRAPKQAWQGLPAPQAQQQVLVEHGCKLLGGGGARGARRSAGAARHGALDRCPGSDQAPMLRGCHAGGLQAARECGAPHASMFACPRRPPWWPDRCRQGTQFACWQPAESCRPARRRCSPLTHSHRP